nr:MAG TPA: hypothetical protein [Caudoviricetes sp.]
MFPVLSGSIITTFIFLAFAASFTIKSPASSFTNRTYLCLSYYKLYVYLCLLFFIIKLTCA